MKKRKKTIVEENKGSLSKKIGKYAVIVVLYIALVSTLAFIMSTISLIVNADSINDTPDYQYMKTSYYNWDSITWRDTNGNNYVTGSNDTFSTEETWSDYYQISRDVEIVNPPADVPTNLTGYQVDVPVGFIASSLGVYYINYQGNPYGNGNLNQYYGDFIVFGVGTNKGFQSFVENQCCFGYSLTSTSENFNLANDEGFSLYVVGGDDVSNPDLIDWFVSVGATFKKIQTIYVSFNNVNYTFVVPSSLVNSSFNDILTSFSPSRWLDVSNVCYLYVGNNDVRLNLRGFNTIYLTLSGGEKVSLSSIVVDNYYYTGVEVVDNSYNFNDNNIMTLSMTFLNVTPLATETEYYTIQRNLSYNSDLSTIDTFVYDSTIISDLKFESIVFEKDNFFLRVGDLNKVGSPQISASVLNGGYDISFDIVGWIKRQDGSTQNITANVDKREDVLGYQYLLPSRQELFGNTELVTNDDMMYIESYRVLVEFPNNYVDNLSYRYGVDSLELNNINYGGALSNWVNSSIGINMGDILLDNVNAFLQFEILPNFTLFNLFVLIVAIPLLIWILKLILGG